MDGHVCVCVCVYVTKVCIHMCELLNERVKVLCICFRISTFVQSRLMFLFLLMSTFTCSLLTVCLSSLRRKNQLRSLSSV